MELYQGSLSQKQPKGGLNHFGSLLAACQRIESLFSAQALHIFDGKIFGIFKHNGTPVKVASPSTLYSDFLEFMGKARICLYRPKLNKGLKLHDCWEDDPIGSGALCIFDDTSVISPAHMKELEALFHPFGKEILYMDVIDRKLSPKTIKAWEQAGRTNSIFKDEFEKRKNRSTVRGENWDEIKPYEVVWTHYTIKLREWALLKGYDFFHYQNDGEDEGSQSYIVLAPKSIGEPIETYAFDTVKLKDIAMPLFEGHTLREHQISKEKRKEHPNSPSLIRDTFWCGLNPTDFLKRHPG